MNKTWALVGFLLVGVSVFLWNIPSDDLPPVTSSLMVQLSGNPESGFPEVASELYDLRRAQLVPAFNLIEIPNPDVNPVHWVLAVDDTNCSDNYSYCYCQRCGPRRLPHFHVLPPNEASYYALR